MKNLIFKSYLIVCVMIFATSCSNNDDDKPVNPSALPATAKTFLTTHFPNASIISADKESSPRPNGSVYDVSLNNGYEIDFDAQGNWTEIDGGNKEIPASLIPEKISAYVAENYPNLFIVQIENEKVKYDIELSDGLDLVFSAQGDFIRIDYDGDNHNEVVVDASVLPDPAKAFLSTHFPSVAIRLVEKQNSARANGTMYDVSLVNGFEIDFDIQGNWTEVDGYRTIVPSAILPEKIMTYVTTNHKKAFIVQIEKEATHYDVELSNDVDLVFAPNGDFIRID